MKLAATGLTALTLLSRPTAALEHPTNTNTTTTQPPLSQYHYYPQLITTTSYKVITISPWNSKPVDPPSSFPSWFVHPGKAPTSTSAAPLNLPSQWLRDAVGLRKLEMTQLGERRKCDELLLNLTRAERRSWAHAIMPNNCRWTLPDLRMDYFSYNKPCYSSIQGLSQAEIGALITGLLPPKCPWGAFHAEDDFADTDAGFFAADGDEDDGHKQDPFDALGEEDEKMCRAAYGGLMKPFVEMFKTHWFRWSSTGLCRKHGYCKQAFYD